MVAARIPHVNHDVAMQDKSVDGALPLVSARRPEIVYSVACTRCGQCLAKLRKWGWRGVRGGREKLLSLFWPIIVMIKTSVIEITIHPKPFSSINPPPRSSVWTHRERTTYLNESILFLGDFFDFFHYLTQILILAVNNSDIKVSLSRKLYNIQCQSNINAFFLSYCTGFHRAVRHRDLGIAIPEFTSCD